MAENWIFFVDTNVFLDFYRLSGEFAKRQLSTLEKHSKLLITTEQVRMEFLKNRQKVISKAITELKAPSKGGMPSIFSEFQSAGALKKSTDRASKYLKNSALTPSITSKTQQPTTKSSKHSTE